MKRGTFFQKPNETARTLWLTLLWLSALLLENQQVAAQCSPDFISPVIVCPANVTVASTYGDCLTDVSLPDATATDNCPGNVTVTSVAPPNGEFPVGETVVGFTATDASGNTATCTTTVFVTGAWAYAVVCNDHVTLPADPSGFTTVEPNDILEGGPYCGATSISIGTAGPTPTVSVPGTGDFLAVCWLELPNGGGFNQCWGTLTIEDGPCTPDQTPPVADCLANVETQSNLNGPNMTRVQATMLNDSSYDVCAGNLNFRATLDLNASAPPANAFVELTGTGNFDVAVWVGDAAGNWSQCMTTVTVTAPECNPDLTPPTVSAPADLTLTYDFYQSLNLDLNDSLAVANAFGSATVWDNCSNGDVLVAISYQEVLGSNGQPIEITRSFWAFDAAFNAADIVSQVITILPEASTIHVPGWFFPGDSAVDSIAHNGIGNELFASSYTDQIYTAACNHEKVRTERTWTVIDWLFSGTPNSSLVLPAFDLNNDGLTGDAYDIVISGDDVFMVQNGQVGQLLGQKAMFYTMTQEIRYNYLDTFNITVSGTVFLDQTLDCELDAGEQKLTNWRVKAIGQNSGRIYETTTLPTGFYTNYHYTLNICPDDPEIELSLDVPFNFGQSCPTIYPLTVAHNAPVVQHVPVQLEDDCPLLSVSLSTWRLRPCFPGDYNVSYCNLSDQTIADAHVEVALDSFINFQGASISGGTNLGDNVFDFPLGTLSPGHCGSFYINFTLNCDAPVGMTHCSEAHIFPDTICDPNAAWSGAWLEAEAYCDGDSARLSLKNIGSGGMADPMEFVVVEDLIIYMMQPFQLGPGETQVFSAPANGATWRIQTNQEDGHPWGGPVAAFVEGCGGLNQPGAALAFPVGTSNPFEATDCVVSVSSFDPNDKYAVPEGYSIQHYIEKNTDIEYTIRFQNTGTDTAYTVVILDTLSAHLDIETIFPGASTHDYDFDLLPGGVLRFAFDSIRLPDSTTNLLASQGYVKYRVSQKPDNPDGTYITNRAGIYFDFNEVVLTNTTWHQVASDFIISVSADDVSDGFEKLKFYPNPSAGEVNFELPDGLAGGRFSLSDNFGKAVRTSDFPGKAFRFEKRDLPQGVYFFKIVADSGRMFSGKVVLK